MGWIDVAILFGTGVELAYGAQAGAEFVTAYLVEKSLSHRQPQPRVVGWLRRHLPIAKEPIASRLFTLDTGKRRTTHLPLALVAVEVMDIMFAIDSIPAAFAVTRTPFILYSSNVFAVLGPRAVRRRLRRAGTAALSTFRRGWRPCPLGRKDAREQVGARPRRHFTDRSRRAVGHGDTREPRGRGARSTTNKAPVMPTMLPTAAATITSDG